MSSASAVASSLLLAAVSRSVLIGGSVLGAAPCLHRRGRRRSRSDPSGPTRRSPGRLPSPVHRSGVPDDRSA